MALLKDGTKRFGLGLGLAAMLAAASVLPTLAADQVTQSVTAGSLTASIANLGLDAKSYSHLEQDSIGNMTLSVDDLRGNGDGWNVQVLSGAFVLGAGSSGHDISASAFSIGTPGDPASVAGQDETQVAAGSGGSLDQARTVISAAAGRGMGSYTQDLPVTLAIPADAYAGTYTAQLTVTANDGPAS